MGTYTSLTTAASGMHAAKAALEIIANNIANASTPGYKRMAPILVEGNPSTNRSVSEATVGSLTGTGVRVAGIRRIQNAYLENRISDATQSFQQWTASRDLLTSIEYQFNELGDSGLGSLLDKFWNQWRDLATNPVGNPPRDAVVAGANILTTRIQEIHRNIHQIGSQINTTVKDRIADINRIAADITEVNEKIVAVESGEYAPNDLLNRRDMLVEELSKIVSISVHGNTGQDFVVNIGGYSLVQGTHSRTVTMELDANGNTQAVWADGAGQLTIRSGELKGLMDVRDQYIPEYLGKMDTLVRTLVEQVNAIHRQGIAPDGTTGHDFFRADSTAANFSVAQAILDNPSLVVSSANGEQSNAEIAQAIADLADRVLIGGETINQAYRSFVAKIGGDVSMASRSSTTREFTLQQLQRQRDSVSGVSLDEEMADMVRFQQAFAASARVFQATNDMLDSLLNSI